LSLSPDDCKLHDVGVLRLKARPRGCALGQLQPGLWPGDLPSNDVRRFLSGRRVAIYGFPITTTGDGQEERPVVGILDSGSPLIPIDVKDDDEGNVLGISEQLRCHTDKTYQLYGMSGAPIVDTQTGLVIGVEHRYDPPDQEGIGGSQVIWANLP